MARFSLYLVVGLIGGALLVSAIARDPGYILLTWGDWQVETSVWFALAGLVAASIAVVTLWRILSSTLRLPGELRRWLDSVRPAVHSAERIEASPPFSKAAGKRLKRRFAKPQPQNTRCCTLFMRLWRRCTGVNMSALWPCWMRQRQVHPHPAR